MNLRRLRTLAGLMESISDHPATNRYINSVLDEVSPNSQSALLDVLEAVRDAWPNGITVDEVRERVDRIHAADRPNRDPIEMAVTEFPLAIRLNSVQGRLQWTAREPDKQELRRTAEMAARWFSQPAQMTPSRTVYRDAAGSARRRDVIDALALLITHPDTPPVLAELREWMIHPDAIEGDRYIYAHTGTWNSMAARLRQLVGDCGWTPDRD